MARRLDLEARVDAPEGRIDTVGSVRCAPPQSIRRRGPVPTHIAAPSNAGTRLPLHGASWWTPPGAAPRPRSGVASLRGSLRARAWGSGCQSGGMGFLPPRAEIARPGWLESVPRVGHDCLSLRRKRSLNAALFLSCVVSGSGSKSVVPAPQVPARKMVPEASTESP